MFLLKIKIKIHINIIYQIIVGRRVDSQGKGNNFHLFIYFIACAHYPLKWGFCVPLELYTSTQEHAISITSKTWFIANKTLIGFAYHLSGNFTKWGTE